MTKRTNAAIFFTELSYTAVTSVVTALLALVVVIVT